MYMSRMMLAAISAVEFACGFIVGWILRGVFL
jgi:hypothetical protein